MFPYFENKVKNLINIVIIIMIILMIIVIVIIIIINNNNNNDNNNNSNILPAYFWVWTIHKYRKSTLSWIWKWMDYLESILEVYFWVWIY